MNFGRHYKIHDALFKSMAGAWSIVRDIIEYYSPDRVVIVYIRNSGHVLHLSSSLSSTNKGGYQRVGRRVAPGPFTFNRGENMIVLRDKWTQFHVFNLPKPLMLHTKNSNIHVVRHLNRHLPARIAFAPCVFLLNFSSRTYILQSLLYVCCMI